MRLLIDNSGYALKNQGDLAMLIVAVSRFHKLLPNAEIRIFTEASSRLKSILPFVEAVSPSGRDEWLRPWNVIGGLYKLFPISLHAWLLHQEALFKLTFPAFSRGWVTRRLAKRGISTESMSAYLDEVEKADVVLVSGGGFVTDAFEYHAVSVLQTLAQAQSYSKPTAMFGQGLGPVKSKKLKAWVKKVLPKLGFITLRESVYSKPLAVSSGQSVNKITVTGDDAIELAFSKKPVKLGAKLGVNLRVAAYSEVGESTIGEFKTVLSEVANELSIELSGVPISIHEADSDLTSIRNILDDQTLDEKDYDSIDKIINKVGGCRLVITGSYHAGVFALSQGVSVIAIVASDYYRQKFEGLAYQFGTGCLLVDKNSPDFQRKLKQLIQESWDRADDIRPLLLEKAEKQIALSADQYSEFAKMCKLNG